MTHRNSLFAAVLAAVVTLGSSAAYAQSDTATKEEGTQQQTEQQTTQSDPAKPCRWWQFGRCNDDAQEQQIEGLPADAPKAPTLITVDVSTNTLYLFRDGELVAKAPAATGTGKILKRGRKVWAFHTPRGRLKVLRKIEDPIWTKPDWAFIEAGEPVPPPDSKKRQVKGHLGKYALDLGDGIMIHGTDEIDSLGRRASHGCVRLGDDMLEKVWQAAKIGTDVYIFDSKPQVQSTTASGRTMEGRSDLD